MFRRVIKDGDAEKKENNANIFSSFGEYIQVRSALIPSVGEKNDIAKNNFQKKRKNRE
jgi:hypothetical protein